MRIFCGDSDTGKAGRTCRSPPESSRLGAVKPAGASPEVAACYDRAPSCATFYVSGPASCPAEAVDGLKGLDKCTWTVLEKQNWMGPDTARFDARQVRVDPARDNGVLVLSARAVSPSGAYLPTGPTKTKDGQVLAEKPYVKRRDVQQTAFHWILNIQEQLIDWVKAEAVCVTRGLLPDRRRPRRALEPVREPRRPARDLSQPLPALITRRC